MVKQRYEYYKGSTAIIDNETDEYVEDVVDVLNQKDFNINELLKTKQLQAKQISDLEAKLAESEKLNKRLQQIIDKLRDKEFAGKHLVEAVNAVYEPLYQNKYDEAEQLKQQLEESESESNARYSAWQEEIGECDRLRVALEEKEKEETKRMEDFEKRCQEYYSTDEYKRDFAIAELEQLKHNILTNQHDDGWLDEQVDIYELTEIIDQQIKELKGEK